MTAIRLCVHTGEEIVNVKYRGPVDHSAFACTSMSPGDDLRRVCYDEAHAYMIVQLDHTYNHYCRIGARTVARLLKAPTGYAFFRSSVRSRFACRGTTPPQY
jgi:hypothetical protein